MDPFDVLGQPQLRGTLLFARGSARPVTAAEVAAALDVPRTAARWRLERLAEAGLLVAGFERRSGRTGPGAGRPAKTYSVAPETNHIELPPRRYEQLVRLLVDALPRRGSAARLSSVGAEFGRELARAARIKPATKLPTALGHTCSALGRLGFQAAVVSVGGNAAVLETPTCPLRPVVLADPHARTLDEGMWKGLVEAALPAKLGAAAYCRTHECLQSDATCRIEIAVRPQRRARAR